MKFRVAVIKWSERDEIAEAIRDELAAEGHTPVLFRFERKVPEDAQLILSFGPYGKFLPIAQQMTRFAPHDRPVLTHWNFEGVPDPRLPWSLVYALSAARSWLDRMKDSDQAAWRTLGDTPPLAWLEHRMYRFRYVGDYFFAYRRGWLTRLVTISPLIAQLYSEHGLPTPFVPWGTSPNWCADLGLERDIDVLWMGKRRNARRSQWIDRVRAELEQHGVRFYNADSVEHPFIFGAQRNEMLNRAKITLNVKSAPHSNGFTFRFHMTAGNRSLVVSEAFVPQSPYYKPGFHFVGAPPEQLADTIRYYLAHENERRELAENAYRLVTTELTLGSSVKTLMQDATCAAGVEA